MIPWHPWRRGNRTPRLAGAAAGTCVALALCATGVPGARPGSASGDADDGGAVAVYLPAVVRWAPAPGTAREDDPLDAFFGLTQVHRIHVDVDDSGVASLLARPRTYVHAGVAIDGAVYEDVGVRLKGGPGSFVPLDGDYPAVSGDGNGRPGKSAFIVDFDRFASGVSHLGLTKLTLNNLVQDPSGIHEFLGYALFRADGVPASRSGFAVVHFNGQEKGLYAVVETADNDVFLRRWFGSDAGNLYEGAFGADLRAGAVDGFDQDNGRDQSRRDLYALASAFDGIDEGRDPLPVLAAHLDLDRYLRFAATEILLGHWDGYVWGANNYMIHHGGPDDRWSFLPWGIDQLFEDPLGPYAGVMRHPGPAWVPGPGGRVHELCFASTECRSRLRDALAEAARTSDRIGLPALARAARRVVEPYVLAEAEAFGDPALAVRAMDQVERYLEDHRAAIETWSPCLVGAVVDQDGDAVDGCTLDCDDHDPGAHPGAIERCNLRDDDCNGRIDDATECPKCLDAADPVGRRYNLCFEPRAWVDAEAFCATRGGHLASIHDPDGDRFLGARFRERLAIGEFWIGLSDREREGAFAWSDGTALDFARWASEAPRPDGGPVDCVLLREPGWQDTACEQGHAFACRAP